MRDPADLEIDEDKTLEQTVEKHQIHIKMLFIKGQPLLATDESIALSQFQEELLQFINETLLQIGFRIAAVLGQS